MSCTIYNKKITKSSISFDITFNDFTDSKAAIAVAFYDNSQRLVQIQYTYVPITLELRTVAIDFSPLPYKESKLFILEDFSSMRPIIQNEDTDLQSTEIIPFASGFITNPLHTYTAYYDVDYNIEKLYAEYDGGGIWNEISPKNYDSFTNNACMIEMPSKYHGMSPSIRLRAYYKNKVSKIDGTPSFQLDGYRIKATLGDYVEYFNPWAVKPYILINASESSEIKDYLKFERTSSSGIREEFYLPLREKSTSRLSINGLSPTSMDKVFITSQNINSITYTKLFSSYYKGTGIKSFKFYDSTDPSIQNYEKWRIVLADCVQTFNFCLNQAGISATIEEVSPSETDNIIRYGEVPGNNAGITQYLSDTKRFCIFVNGDPTAFGTSAALKSVTLHEMGHLLGFNDSPYAIDDSIYSYARDHDAVTYFQPNDIATMMSWMK